MPLLGHEAGIKQAAEVLGDGWAAHLEMSRNRVHGAVGLDEQIQHPASRRMTDCPKDSLLAIGSPHHVVIMRKQQLTSQVRAKPFTLGRADAATRPPSPGCQR
jgi:hypothetical protein